MKRSYDSGTIEKELFGISYSNRHPVYGSLELTPCCNFNCNMCYVKKENACTAPAEKWLKIGKEMKEKGVLFLLLTGGESLLYKGFEEVYTGLREMGFVLSVNTNGSLIDQYWIDFFKRNRPRQLNITVYGSSDSTYENLCHSSVKVKDIEKNLFSLKENGIDFRISFTAVPENVCEAEDIQRLAERLQVPVQFDTYVLPVAENGEFKKDARLSPSEAAGADIDICKLTYGSRYGSFCRYIVEMVNSTECEEEPHTMQCGAGRCTFSVNWQGNLTPCVIMKSPSCNAFDNGFSSAWEYMKKETDRILLNSKCMSCNMRELCNMCAAAAYTETGSFCEIPEYVCEHTKEKYRRIFQEVNCHKEHYKDR